MANVVQAQKKIALLHRYPANRIKETNAAFPYLQAKGIDVLTFKKFDRLGSFGKFWKSLAWILYAPLLVIGRGYDVIYCDDSYPFYPIFVKLASPKSKVVLRIGDFHLMYYYSKPLWIFRMFHFLEKITWKIADKIIAISDYMALYISYEVQRSVYIALDPVDRQDFEAAFAASGPGNGVMFHGVLTRNKKVDLLLEAARRMPETQFTIVGDGPDRARLQSHAPPNVTFLGWKPFSEMPALIATCAVGVALRSDNPGNEYVVTSPFLQYGIMGKPCLVTRRKVFGDYEWQFSGIDEMVWKLRILLAAREEGLKLREQILKNHDAQIIAEDIWATLESA